MVYCSLIRSRSTFSSLLVGEAATPCPNDREREHLLTLWHLDCPCAEPAKNIGQNVVLDFVFGEPDEYGEQTIEDDFASG